MSEALFGNVDQIGFVVWDVRASARDYLKRLGIGPWWVKSFKPPLLSHTRLRGKPVEYTYDVALAYTGSTQLEIIAPLEGPSIYKEFLEANGEGLHHLRYNIAEGLSYEMAGKELISRGFSAVMQGRFSGIEYTYFDTEKPGHTVFEILKRSPGSVLPDPDYWYPSKPEYFGGRKIGR
jgi:hypothetical protein